jgi:hypothetical protein
MSHEQFSELRRLLTLSPSLKLWEQLIELLDKWPQDSSRDVALDYCEAHIEHWSDGLRPRMLRRDKPDSKAPTRRLGRLLFSDLPPPELLKRLAEEDFPDSRHWVFQHMPDDKIWKQLDESGAFSQMEGFYGTPQKRDRQLQLAALENTFESRRLKRWALAPVGTGSLDILTMFQRESFASLQHLVWRFSSTTGGTNLRRELPLLHKASFLSSLRTLSLFYYMGVSVDLSALFLEERLQELKHLVFSGIYASLSTWTALANSAAWESLEKLELSNSLRNTASFEALLCHSPPPKLQKLTLGNAENISLPRTLLPEMERHGWFEKLKTLELTGIKLPQSYAPLTQEPWRELEELSFRGCTLNPTVLRWWFEKKELPKLRRLRFNNTALSKSALSVLADCQWLSSVEILELNECSITDEGLAALLTSSNLGGLREVSLERNELTNQSWATLRDSGLLEQWNVLYINRNHFTKGTKKAIRRVPSVELHHVSEHPVKWFNDVFLYN